MIIMLSALRKTLSNIKTPEHKETSFVFDRQKYLVRTTAKEVNVQLECEHFYGTVVEMRIRNDEELEVIINHERSSLRNGLTIDQETDAIVAKGEAMVEFAHIRHALLTINNKTSAPYQLFQAILEAMANVNPET